MEQPDPARLKYGGRKTNGVLMRHETIPWPVKTFYDGDIKPAVIDMIRKSYAVLGCIAWLSDYDVIKALSGAYCHIFTSDQNQNIEELSLNHYSHIKPYLFARDGDHTNAIRVVPGLDSGGMMHHKFLVFIDSTGTPFCASTGSWNATMTASTKNREDYSFITDRETVISFYGRFMHIHHGIKGAT